MSPTSCPFLRIASSFIQPSFDMSRQATFSNTTHLRDFVDSITDNPSREKASNYIEIQTDINIFEEDGFYGSRIDVDPIHTRIRAYLT